MMKRREDIGTMLANVSPKGLQNLSGIAPTRRVFLATPALLAVKADAQQPFPTRPIRLMVGSASAGSLDFVGRVLANGMADILGQPMVVENRGGAQGALAMDPVLRAAPDGHTLVINNMGALLINPLVQNMPIDQQPLEVLEPIALVADVLTVLVTSKDRSWASVSDLLASARANPGSLSWGHPGVGSSPWLAALLLSQMAGIQTIGVPYRGGGPAATDLLGGHVPVGVLNISSQMIEYHRAGRLRILAVTTAKRAGSASEIPTAIESGLRDMVALNFAGLFVPAATPAATVERVSTALRAAIADKALVKLFSNAGLEMSADDTPERAQRFIESEIGRWSPVIRSIGLKPG